MASQHIHSESFARVQMRMSASTMIDTDENEHGIERNGRKCVRRHAVNFSLLVDRDDCDASRETAHRLSKVCLVETHSRRNLRDEVEARGAEAVPRASSILERQSQCELNLPRIKYSPRSSIARVRRAFQECARRSRRNKVRSCVHGVVEPYVHGI
jgi:hypothetical protein